jgi:hypothetical protein
MRRKRSISLAVVFALGAFAAVIVPSVPAAAQVNEVTNWNRIATTALVQFPGPAGGAPPALSINMAMVQGAVYDAVNAIEPMHEPYLLKRTFPSTSSKEAAVATAAFTILSSVIARVPDSIAFPNEGALLTFITYERDKSLAAIPESQSKTDGIAAGLAAAERMIAVRQGDGRFGPSQWDRRTGPGYWQPLVDANQMPILDPTPWVGLVEPFLLPTSSYFRSEGPNALTSNQYAKDVNEVKALGGNGIPGGTPSARTPEQTHNAIFWQSAGGPVVTFNRVARDLVEDPSYRVDLDDSALLFGMLNLSVADASINCWNDKYHFDFWRPWQAIREADTDGNRKTDPDTSWTSLLTAPYPEHPSGHMCQDGALLTVLRSFFGRDKISFSVTSSQFGGETRDFERFSEPLREITEARIWAGLHFRTADVQGAELGENVANFAMENYFQPLD